MKLMKYCCLLVCTLFLYGGSAVAEATNGGRAPQFLLFPSWYEVVDIIKQGKEKKDEETPLSGPRKGGLHPYLGFNDFSPNSYLLPGNSLDVSGGVIYFAPREGNEARVGMIFAVRDRVSNRLEGYSFDPNNLTPWVSFSISY